MRNNNKISVAYKQRGATLFTALVFLTLMTVVSVSASKISLIDVLVAGNNQQQMMAYHSTDNDLKELTTVVNLYKPLVNTVGHIFNASTGIYEYVDTHKPKIKQEITDRGIRYQCGGFSGKALSIGPSVSPCDLYDFQVETKRNSGAASDRHNRGAGKEKPSPKKDSYL